MKTVDLCVDGVRVFLALRTRVTVISGDSGMGKTFLAETISSLQDQKPNSSVVFVVQNKETFDVIDSSNKEVILIDGAEQYLADSPNAIRECIHRNQEKYFVIFLRGHLSVPYTVRNMADIVATCDNDSMHISIEYHVRDIGAEKTDLFS